MHGSVLCELEMSICISLFECIVCEYLRERAAKQKRIMQT